MVQDYRLTIRSTSPDPRAEAIHRTAGHLGLICPVGLAVADVLHLRGDLTNEHLEILANALVASRTQTSSWAIPEGTAVEVCALPGVTDAAAAALLHLSAVLDIPVSAAASGRRYEFPADTGSDVVATLIHRLLSNPVVETWSYGTAQPSLEIETLPVSPATTIDITNLDADELEALSRTRGLALDVEELQVIAAHFAELGREPTDVELETLAQTWSEHCAHKTFRATIDLLDGNGLVVDHREPLLDTLRRCTEDITAPFVRSAFVGNAGVVEFDQGITIALKAETHNHPSAIEPFGGANTGVGGVIRDVLGMAHRPTAITDILCFGPDDLPLDQVPDGALHPSRIADGVIDGVADYGNKIGLPTVAGAVVRHPAYTTNPLVFAGCIGTSRNWQQQRGPHPGDRTVLLGGRTGRDGIRGATFSSLTMDATTGSVAGASVQIGNPITEKLLIDALIGAEHLYSAITDCGAGGLSSAVGEMAEDVGADVDLDRVPLKYAGLEAWEIWLSEAQERMVVAVPAESMTELEQRCRRHGVEMTDIGHFTGDGRLIVRHGGTPVVDISTRFLHDGRPRRHLMATVPNPNRVDTERAGVDPSVALLALLAHPNLNSREPILRRYDHEIGGATLGRPIIGIERDAPADAALLAAPADSTGIAIGIGVNPLHGLADPERMGWSVVDEAIRNVVAIGADPDRIALLDNFSFGDPRRLATLGDLVAAVDGCTQAARSFSAPFVSGKDSLNNEYTGPDGHRHAVPPTLVITAVAHVPDLTHRPTPTLQAPDNLIVLTGTTGIHFGGSHLDEVLGQPSDAHGSVPAPDANAPARYRALHACIRAGLVQACHDLAEGGLAVALAEMCIAGRLGVSLSALGHDDAITGLFSESCGRHLIEVSPDHLAQVQAIIPESTVLGRVTAEPVMQLPGGTQIELAALVTAHTGRGVQSV
ncbi:phosphoribosylformylglycinamidine synthase subunit PurL [Ilumatobacteraceae bacterium]|nr:phosphoribosylformylglycinamidine synthase subunit PurL [Ilumatobacteraceae bacterium]